MLWVCLLIVVWTLLNPRPLLIVIWARMKDSNEYNPDIPKDTPSTATTSRPYRSLAGGRSVAASPSVLARSVCRSLLCDVAARVSRAWASPGDHFEAVATCGGRRLMLAHA